MSETPESQQPAGTTTESTGIAWGDDISPERLVELKEMFERQKIWVAQLDRNVNQSVFKDVKLTGADVFWLAALALNDPDGNLGETAAALKRPFNSPDLSELHLERANLTEAKLQHAKLHRVQLQRAMMHWAQLQGAYLRGAQLQGAILGGAQVQHAVLEEANLQGAILHGANLQQAFLSGAQLDGADLGVAILVHADLRETLLQQANLSGARLQNANLYGAQLQNANLLTSQLQDTNLYGARLEGADLRKAQLQQADLRASSFDKTSRLDDANLVEVSLDQVTFDNTNLTVVSWATLKRLGDERNARKARSTSWKVEAFHKAARAYRSLSVALRNQGLGADATRFHYRAELMERKSYFWQIFANLGSRRFYTAPAFFGRWLFSWLLGTFAGYGDYFGRLLLTYLLVVSTFAGLMFLAAGRVVSFDAIRDVFVLSVTSFHGRGVQPPGLTMTDTLATLTAVEAFFGLLIEGIFIAAFTRRVTGN